jgi:RNA polymerase sigma-70 factor (ECF subfamily)
MGERREQPLRDAEWVARARAGEVDAFGALYQRYFDPIYRYLRSRVASEQDAEDLAETVFLRAFQALPRYRERGWPFSAFLYQVARNLLADSYRRPQMEVPLEELEAGLRSPRPVEQMDEQRERVERLSLGLTRLAPDYQEVIRLRVLLGLPTREVAAWMERSEGAIRVLLYRALRELRVGLTDDSA